MLILSRRRGEEIVIGEGPDAVTVTLVEVRGDRVRLGITAAQTVPIHRAEVYEAIHGARPAAEE